MFSVAHATAPPRRADVTAARSVSGCGTASLRHHFLARYLARALDLPVEQTRAAWQLSAPSNDTLTFLRQLRADRDARQRDRDATMLAALAAPRPSGAFDVAAVVRLTCTRPGAPDRTARAVPLLLAP